MNLAKEKTYLLNQLGFKPQGSFLAGGAITSLFTNDKINDFDLYFKSKEDFVRALEYAYEDHLWCVHVSSRAITFAIGNEVYQMMYFDWFETADQIFDKFDFTACMGALDLDTKDFIFHPRFMADVAKRELKFNPNTLYPLASGVRTLKYQERGFSLNKHEMIKVLMSCVFKNVTSWDELRDQLGGNYGERVFSSPDKEFTLDNAIEALEQPREPKTHEEILKDMDKIPANFEQAYRLVFNEEPSQVL